MRHAASFLLTWLGVAGAAPPPAAPAVPSIRDVVELTDLSSVAASPDGHWVAYRRDGASLERNDDELAWYVVPVDGSAPPRRLAGAGEGVRSDGFLLAELPRWSADSRAFYFRKVEDGEVQVWRASVDGSPVAAVTSDPGDVQQYMLTPDGALVYAAGAPRAEIAAAERAEYDRGIRFDATVDPGRALYRSGRINGRAATDRLTGFWFAHAGLLGGRPPRYVRLDLAAGTSRPATASEQAMLLVPTKPFDQVDGRYVIARAVAADGSVAHLLAEGTNALITVRRPDGRAMTCQVAACHGHIDTIAWQEGSEAIVFSVTAPDTSQTLYRWSVGAGEVRRIGFSGGRLNGGRDNQNGCAITPTAAICVSEAANAPPQLVAVDLASGTTRVLDAPNAALAASPGPRFATLSWHDAHGRRFTGQFAAGLGPPGHKPLFVTYYLCDGYLRGGVGEEYPLRQLPGAGIAVLCINQAPTELGFGDRLQELRIAQGGIIAAVDLLASRGLVDRSRVGMGGLSFGAEVTGWMATHTPLLRAAAMSSTVMTPTFWWFNALRGRDAPEIMRKVWRVGSPEQDPARWRLLSPFYRLEHVTAPILMQMSEQEYRYNLELAVRLSRAGRAVDLWVFPDEQHIKSQPRHKAAVYARHLDWFRLWLQGHVDPAPDKRAQFAAWTALRADQPARLAPSRRSQASASTSDSR